MIKKERIYQFPATKQGNKSNVIYWMSRDQRVKNNWGLIHALDLREKMGSEIAVVFTLIDKFLDATLRQYSFMIGGLKEVEEELTRKNIPFYILTGDPVPNLREFTLKHNAGFIVCDFDPLRIKRKWQKEVSELDHLTLLEVDSHNIVPARHVSDKQEFGAYTIRPRITRKLEAFLEEFPEIQTIEKQESFSQKKINWKKMEDFLQVDQRVKPVTWLKPGEKAGIEMLGGFLERRLTNYAAKRNDPNEDVLSGLSPYFHFGQISAQGVALEVIKNQEKNENTDAFLEEMIVRKELSDNYCHYNPEYDTLKNLPDWSRKTIEAHRKDEREHLYSETQLEEAETHDQLWNAAQNEMREKGKMHGYMRMYWAKKILEWTKNPESAMRIAVYLNDKYELDGRDPNGYTGCAWAIAGIHDRAWTERPVFGKIRYMNYNGAKRKFDVKKYIRSWAG